MDELITLGIETATPACAVALKAPGVLDVRVLDTHRRHGEHLMAGVASVLAEHALVPRDVERVVVDRGPGLFTGLRVGVASAVAFAQAAGSSLVAVTSLEMLAHGAHARGVRGRLASLVDARRGELFVQVFELGATVRVLDEPRVAAPSDVAAQLAGSPLRLTGDGATRYRELLEGVGEILEDIVPPLAAALEIASERAAQTHVSPLYLRDADAVANFATRDGSP